MELRSYLAVLLRRWPLIVILPLIVVLVGVYQDATRTTNYTATARVSFIRSPDPPVEGDYTFDEYYNYLASEFAVDDMVEIVGGSVFSEAVADRLRETGVDISGEEVKSAVSPDRKHRIVSLATTTTDPGRSILIAVAAAQELQESGLAYLGSRNGESPAIVQMVEIPTEARADTGRARLILLLGFIVAAGLGALVALLIDYLDDRLYEPEAVSHATGLPHLATVPGDRG